MKYDITDFTGRQVTVSPRLALYAVKDFMGTELPGLAVILDLHKCPGHDFHLGCTQEQPFFSDPECRKDACKVWAMLAERYADQHEVMLELLNEPAGQDSKVWDVIKDELYKNVRRTIFYSLFPSLINSFFIILSAVSG